MMTNNKALKRLVETLENSYSLLRGATITVKEYEEIIEKFEELKSQVLLPATMPDRHKDK